MTRSPISARWIILSYSGLALVGGLTATILGLSSTVIGIAVTSGLLGLTCWAIPAWFGSLLLLIFASGLWWSGAPLWWILATCGLAALAYIAQGFAVTAAGAARALPKLKPRRRMAVSAATSSPKPRLQFEGPLWRKAVIIVIGAFCALGLAILAARVLAPAASELVSDVSPLLSPWGRA